MKKILIILLAAAVVIMPFSSLHGEEYSMLDKYRENDPLLLSLYENHSRLLENREETLEFYEKYRINRSSTYNIALSQAARENGLARVDIDIENALYEAMAREALLAINFRSSYLSLFNKKTTAEKAMKQLTEAKKTRDEDAVAYSKGYISGIEKLQAEYNHKKASNDYYTSIRSYESALRRFNESLGNDILFTDIDFNFDEELQALLPLDHYMTSAMENSSSLFLLEQAIDRYETDLYYLTQYSISDNLGHYHDKKLDSEINLRILRLMLRKAGKDLEEKVSEQYDSLMLEMERLSLDELSIEILENDHAVNRRLFGMGLIDSVKLAESMEALENGRMGYVMAVYDFNTMVMSLEYDSACFISEDDE